jgi:hypothetical protein
MKVHVFDTKKRASSFCKKKNKYAREYRWKYQKREHGGYGAYKSRK